MLKLIFHNYFTGYILLSSGVVELQYIFQFNVDMYLEVQCDISICRTIMLNRNGSNTLFLIVISV